MDSMNNLIDKYSFPKDDQLITKVEHINVDFIKNEETEEEYFVVPGIVESLKADKVLSLLLEYLDLNKYAV